MNYVKKVIYNCKQATFLIEKQQLVKLSFMERMEMRIHLTGCDMCKLYYKQSYIINGMVQQFFNNALKEGLTLDDDFKNGLQVRIENGLK